MNASDHDKLDVSYMAAIDFVALANEVVEHLPRGRGYLADQLQRCRDRRPILHGRHGPRHRLGFDDGLCELDEVGQPGWSYRPGARNLRQSCPGLERPHHDDIVELESEW